MILVFEQRQITASFSLEKTRENSDCPRNNVAVGTGMEYGIHFPVQNYDEVNHNPIIFFLYIDAYFLECIFLANYLIRM